MKSFLITFTTAIILSVFLTPVVFAVTAGEIPTNKDMGITQESPVKDVSSVLDIARAVVKYTYILFFIIMVMFVLFAAYNYLSGADNPEKLSHARHQLIYAAIATIIAFTAVGFEVIIKNFIGGGAETTAGTTGLPASGTGGGTTQKEATNLNNPSGGPTSPPLPPGSFQGDYIPPTGG